MESVVTHTYGWILMILAEREERAGLITGGAEPREGDIQRYIQNNNLHQGSPSSIIIIAIITVLPRLIADNRLQHSRKVRGRPLDSCAPLSVQVSCSIPLTGDAGILHPRHSPGTTRCAISARSYRLRRLRHRHHRSCCSACRGPQAGLRMRRQDGRVSWTDGLPD